MQYLRVTWQPYPQVPTILGMEQGALTPRQQLLAEVRDKLCGGNSAELARRINKDPTYINRLFYPADKKGHKGIGLEIMDACTGAFFLPNGFWDRQPPGLADWEVTRSATLRALRNEAMHSSDPQAMERFQRALRLNDPGAGRPREKIWESLAATVGPDLPLGAPPFFSKWSAGEKEVPMLPRGPEHTTEPAPTHGMQPILAWQFEEELPPGEFVMVPRLDVHLSAGHGNGTSQVEIQFNEGQPQAFRAEWIRQQHLRPKKLAAMNAVGDSMEPTIHDGDSLLVDTSQTEVVDGRVYAIWYDGGERVKRLFRLPGAGLRIESDNQRYRAIELGADFTGHVRVIGRIVHRSGVGGL